MAKFLKSQIFIDGEEFLPAAGYEIEIYQQIANHHSFKISFPTESTEAENALMDESINHIGKKVSITVNDWEFEFIGLITDANLSKSDGSNGSLILQGYSPTILMEQTVQSASYDEGTTLDQVISQTTEEYPADLVKIISGNETSLSLPYTVQYNENDFAFLQRMSARYGIWFYYNGEELCIGNVGDQTFEGVYGDSIVTFELGVKMQPQQFEVKSQDWVENTVLESESSAYQPSSPHTYSKQIKDISDNVYRKKGNYHYTHTQNEFIGQKGIDDATKVAVLGNSAKMIKASGVTELPNLRVGAILTVEGIDPKDHTKKNAYGSYILTKVVHSFDHAGHYRNHFEGVADGTAHPEYSDVFATPKAGTQRAKVTDNLDPKGLGRVKVQFPWQADRDMHTPWIRVNTPYAGATRGVYFVPEIDDEVLVAFEGDNAECPYVESVGYNTETKSEIDPADNNIKAIITRSGHTIQFDDTDGGEKINIYDKEGTIITFDTVEKSLYIQAPENIEIGAKNITITAEENVSIGAGKNIALAADGDLTAVAKGDVGLQSDGDTTIKSGGEAAIEATSDATLKGQKTIVEGKTAAELNGAQTKVTGSAMTEVSGATVKVN